MDGVNIYRSQLVTHTFHMVLYAAKACLLPFVTLYFRQLGLTATQTGIIVGAKAALSVIGGGFWATCAIKCNKRRLVLMLSVFITMASFLLLTVVPPINKTIELEFCNGNYSRYRNSSMEEIDVPYDETVTEDISQRLNETLVTEAPPDMKDSLALPLNSSTKISSSTKLPTLSTRIVARSVSPSTDSSSNEMVKNLWKNLSDEDKKTFKNFGFDEESLSALDENTLKQILETFGQVPVNPTVGLPSSTATMNTPIPPSIKSNAKQQEKVEKFWNSLSHEDKKRFKSFGFDLDNLLTLDAKTFREIMQTFDNTSGNRKKRSESNSNIIGSVLNDLNSKVSKLQESMQATKYATFAGVMVLMLATEILTAPTEKLADSYWFELVDLMDVLERYGGHKVWSTIGFAITPLIVTGLVDRTPCVLSYGINHFLIHFYGYAILMGLAFIIAIFYPVLKNQNAVRKVNRYTRLSTGLGIMFSDCHALSYTITVLILGVVTAVMDNFMFWMMQDIGSSELYMGGTLVLASAGDIIFFMFMKLLIKRITNAGAVILGLFVLTLRLLVFSFMWMPWMALPVGLFHAFSNTLLWGAVESYQDFKVNPFIMDRSAKSVMLAMYTGIGYAGGSVVSGILYDQLGLSLVLQGGAVLVFSWCILFVLIQKCAQKKHRVRYAKLLQAEEDRITDSSDEEDWLEVALKSDKTH